MWLSPEGCCGSITSHLCPVRSDLVDRGAPLSLPFDAFPFLPGAIFLLDFGVQWVISFWFSGMPVLFLFSTRRGLCRPPPTNSNPIVGYKHIVIARLGCFRLRGGIRNCPHPFPLPASLLFDWFIRRFPIWSVVM